MAKTKPKPNSPAKSDLKVTATQPPLKTVRRTFPGPAGANVALRVAIDRSAHADLVAHAKASLDREICGVLVGQVGEDDDGLFVHVEASIAGAEAASGSRHVTFTQETWTAIHRMLDQFHPGRRILGWYHTHPGFGVEFSEMDLFIQRNFFPESFQVALVMDPLSGAVALCRNGLGGIEYLPRYWVDGREHQCRLPATSQAALPGAAEGTAGVSESLQVLETRVGQLVQALDEQRQSFQRFLLAVGVVCLVLVGFGVLKWVLSLRKGRLEPPRLNTYVPVPVRVGEHNVLLGVEVVDWRVPDELNALMLDLEEQLLKQAATSAPPDQSTGTSASNQTANPAPTRPRP